MKACIENSSTKPICYLQNLKYSNCSLLRSYSVYLVHFIPFCSISVYFSQILSNPVHFGLFCFTSVQSDLIQSISATSVSFSPFRSISVHFGLIENQIDFFFFFKMLNWFFLYVAFSVFGSKIPFFFFFLSRKV